MNDQPKRFRSFTPVPARARSDGWTPEKQIAFIEALAECGIVDEACRRVGMSDTSVYELRRRPCGAPFREAWDAAIDYSMHFIESGAINRARNGVPRPIFYKGEQVGEWRHFDERLTMFLLRTYRPHRYGKWRDGLPLELEEDDCNDAAIRLDGGIVRIEWQSEGLSDDTDQEESDHQEDGDKAEKPEPDDE